MRYIYTSNHLARSYALNRPIQGIEDLSKGFDAIVGNHGNHNAEWKARKVLLKR
jgi:hypothetical protein